MYKQSEIDQFNKILPQLEFHCLYFSTKTDTAQYIHDNFSDAVEDKKTLVIDLCNHQELSNALKLYGSSPFAPTFGDKKQFFGDYYSMSKLYGADNFFPSKAVTYSKAFDSEKFTNFIRVLGPNIGLIDTNKRIKFLAGRYFDSVLFHKFHTNIINCCAKYNCSRVIFLVSECSNLSMYAISLASVWHIELESRHDMESFFLLLEGVYWYPQNVNFCVNYTISSELSEYKHIFQTRPACFNREGTVFSFNVKK